MKAIIFGNIYQEKKAAYVESILCELSMAGFDLIVDEMFHTFISKHLDGQLPQYSISSELDKSADIAISVGGDGTFLHTASRVAEAEIPILGINTGRLGFLADMAPQQLHAMASNLAKGNFKTEPRTLLSTTLSPLEVKLDHPFALNEVAVLKHDNSSTIEITTHINGKFLTNYTADGLVVCTPTGSTGYSLSAGGPILTPDSRAFCLSPVAPHSLSIRPVVLCDDVEVTLSVSSRTHHFMIALDGRSQSLKDDVQISLKKAPHTVHVVKIAHPDFFDTLRQKMMWGADKRML